MPLVAGAGPESLRGAVMAALCHEIYVGQANHLDTGVHATYFMYKLLTDTTSGYGGNEDIAIALTTVQGHPRYHDLLQNGYTTWPEWWGGCLDNSSHPVALPTEARPHECKT